MLNEDKKKAIQTLKTCRGQIDGIIKMIEDGRYCIDVSNQIMASQALIKKANMLILKQHLEHCIREACESNDTDNKIDEMVTILEKVIKS